MYEDPHQAQEQFDQEMADLDAISAMNRESESRPVRRTEAQAEKEELDWLVAYLQARYPRAWKEAVEARQDEITRRHARKASAA